MLKQHPLSAAWPAMQPDEYQALKDSIENIGVQNPITLYEGMVIDGWHRYSAAKDLGVECPTKNLEDVDPVDFVKSQNDARRNVTASQRAAAITAIYAWKPAGKPAPGAGLEKTSAELAEIAGVSERTIRQAKAVHAKASQEVKDAVRTGKMSMKKASETVKPKNEKPAKKQQPEPTKTQVDESPKPAPKEYDSDGKPVEEFSELDAAHEHIETLQAALAVASMGDVSAEDKTLAADMIAALRKENDLLRKDLEAVTRSRDQMQNELAAAKKLCISQQNQIKRLKS